MSLANFIQYLRDSNELTEIKVSCSPKLEITEITDRISKQPDGGKALLFTNNGTGFPLLINGYGSSKRMLAAMHLGSYEEFEQKISLIFNTLTQPNRGIGNKLKVLNELRKLSAYFPVSKKGRGSCQQVIIREPDLSVLPVLTCWPCDAGPFITLPMVHTKDPVTGSLNVGMYRMQVMGKNVTGMHWHMHKTGARHYDEYRKAGKRIPVAVALGGDPVYGWCASAPLPDGVNEYILAGFLRNAPVKMVKCISQDMEVPEDADIVLEGYVDPSEELVEEGPFGDHTGFYSLPEKYPLFHVTCITHRKNAVYPATIVGIPPQEDYYMIEASERIFQPLIRLTQLPEMTGMHMPSYGTAHNLVIVAIRNKFPGHAQKVIHSLWGAGQMMFTKVIVVVDHDVNIRDYPSLLKAMAENTRPGKDIFISSGATDVLDHAADTFVFAGKTGIDATRKNEKQILPEVNLELLPKSYKANTQWLKQGIPFLPVSGIRNASETGFMDSVLTSGNLIAALCDFDINEFPAGYWLWLMLANLDPSRDIIKKELSNNRILWIINALSFKTKSDNSPWPSITVSDNETVSLVNRRWHEYHTGEFIASPSDLFRFLADSGPVK
jgi:4-hydroxy-3-polyprenylbenzoate decarboxylase